MSAVSIELKPFANIKFTFGLLRLRRVVGVEKSKVMSVFKDGTDKISCVPTKISLKFASNLPTILCVSTRPKTLDLKVPSIFNFSALISTRVPFKSMFA